MPEENPIYLTPAELALARDALITSSRADVQGRSAYRSLLAKLEGRTKRSYAPTPNPLPNHVAERALYEKGRADAEAGNTLPALTAEDFFDTDDRLKAKRLLTAYMLGFKDGSR